MSDCNCLAASADNLVVRVPFLYGDDAAFFARYVANPSQFGNNVMPSFENLGEENLTAIAAFLEASKGEQ